MPKDPPQARSALSRRGFFSIAAVAVGQGALASGIESAELHTQPETDDREPVYRETAHITAFYHHSRF